MARRRAEAGAARPPVDRRDDAGPFDIIGDIHGCFDELVSLLKTLGYEVDPLPPGEGLGAARHPDGRRVIFVGDLTDRGPRNVDVLRLAMGMVASGTALAVCGNHDDKLRRYLAGNPVVLNQGLDLTAAELERTSQTFRDAALRLIEGMADYLWLDGGELMVVHAGLREEMFGTTSGEVRRFALYGDVTGEVDENGMPVRGDWARDYRGEATIVYGHTPMTRVRSVNRAICIDTGCVFGNALSAITWPETRVVSVPAAERYRVARRPLEVPDTAEILPAETA
ncbi:metallophosphoesterase [Acuticoccus sediminis]|uniref:metallophosphoesterase n=1 Tax=Acuticoccus sediminis TaxID=2184697 RepID=UPI001CFC6B73|nr:metallophosphoesterase [Acuticoccus sediminis]